MVFDPMTAVHEAAHVIVYIRVADTIKVRGKIQLPDENGKSDGFTIMGQRISPGDRAKVCIAASIGELVLFPRIRMPIFQ